MAEAVVAAERLQLKVVTHLVLADLGVVETADISEEHKLEVQEQIVLGEVVAEDQAVR
jgi:hypothetical protein